VRRSTGLRSILSGRRSRSGVRYVGAACCRSLSTAAVAAQRFPRSATQSLRLWTTLRSQHRRRRFAAVALLCGAGRGAVFGHRSRSSCRRCTTWRIAPEAGAPRPLSQGHPIRVRVALDVASARPPERCLVGASGKKNPDRRPAARRPGRTASPASPARRGIPPGARWCADAVPWFLGSAGQRHRTSGSCSHGLCVRGAPPFCSFSMHSSCAPATSR
jgi:hypothetical protein